MRAWIGVGAMTALAACGGAGPMAAEDAAVIRESVAVAPGGAPTFTEVVLQNGWTNAPFATRNAGVSLVSGIVHFAGAIAGGTSPVAFILPVGFRPATNVYVPVDLCNATNGRLVIQPSGAVSVEAEGGMFSNAQCFTSLESASFAPSANGFTALALQNGWTNAPFSTSNAAVENLQGIVHFKGAIAGGANPAAFTLPFGFRPATNVYVPVDLCGAANGRLVIQPSGAVTIQAEGGTFSNAQCLTSLDGASFAQDTSTFAPLTLQNGWTNAPFGTGTAAFEDIDGILYFKGAIAGGANSVVFTLPSVFRPATNVYVPVDLCNATKGRLVIQPSGAVTIQAEGGTFSNAQCFTSLDGVTFAIAIMNPGPCPDGTTDCRQVNGPGVYFAEGGDAGIGTSRLMITHFINNNGSNGSNVTFQGRYFDAASKQWLSLLGSVTSADYQGKANLLVASVSESSTMPTWTLHDTTTNITYPVSSLVELRLHITFTPQGRDPESYILDFSSASQGIIMRWRSSASNAQPTPYCIGANGAADSIVFQQGIDVDPLTGSVTRNQSTAGDVTMSCSLGAPATAYSWGYHYTGTLDETDYFDAAIYMKRASYCADSRYYTTAGTEIQINDNAQIKAEFIDHLEAWWTREGAICLNTGNRRHPEIVFTGCPGRTLLPCPLSPPPAPYIAEGPVHLPPLPSP